MKKAILQLSVILFLVGGVSITSCKNKKSTTETTNTTTRDTLPDAPVEISTDTELTNGVQDATKDFPGVTATVSNGEITLTGKISKDRLPTLMQSLHSLKPKKINNNLTIE